MERRRSGDSPSLQSFLIEDVEILGRPTTFVQPVPKAPAEHAVIIESHGVELNTIVGSIFLPVIPFFRCADPNSALSITFRDYRVHRFLHGLFIHQAGSLRHDATKRSLESHDSTIKTPRRVRLRSVCEIRMRSRDHLFDRIRNGAIWYPKDGEHETSGNWSAKPQAARLGDRRECPSFIDSRGSEA